MIIRAAFACLALLTCTTINGTAAASEEVLPASAEAPYEALSALNEMLGDWQVTTSSRTEDGGWEQQSKSRTKIASSLRGLEFSETHVESLEGSGFAVNTVYTFDQYRNIYRAFATDDTFGLGDVYEGHLKDGVLTLDNLRADTFYPLDGGGKMHFRLRIPVAGDTREMFVDLTTDGGKNWAPAYRSIYEREGA